MKESISINIILAVLAKHGKVMPKFRNLDIACAKEIYDALNAEPETYVRATNRMIVKNDKACHDCKFIHEEIHEPSFCTHPGAGSALIEFIASCQNWRKQT